MPSSSSHLDHVQTSELLQYTPSDLTPSLLSHLRSSLPLLKLLQSTADTPYHAKTRRLLSHILAQLHLQTSYHYQLSTSDIDNLSILLAQNTDTDVADMIENWNELTPAEFHADSTTIATQIHKMRSETRRLKDEATALDSQIRQVRSEANRLQKVAFEKVLEAVEMDIAERSTPQSADAAKVDAMVARGKATSGKLKLLQKDFERRVYTEENVALLVQIKEELERREEERKQRLEEGRQKLAAYQACGPEFESIVSEILQLRKELEHKQWERDELIAK